MENESYCNYSIIRESAGKIFSESEKSLDTHIVVICGCVFILAVLALCLFEAPILIVCFSATALCADIGVFSIVMSIFMAKKRAKRTIDFVDKRIIADCPYDETAMTKFIDDSNNKVEAINTIALRAFCSTMFFCFVSILALIFVAL